MSLMAGFWALPLFVVYVLTYAMNKGIVRFLMWWPEGRFDREQYKTLQIGDSLYGLPFGMLGLATVWQLLSLEIQRGFAIFGLVAAIVVVVGMFAMERITNQYTLEEQLTPSKMAHTLSLGVLVGLLGSIFPVLWHWPIELSRILLGSSSLSVERQWWLIAATVAIVVGFGVWLEAMMYDNNPNNPKPMHPHKSRRLMEKYELVER